MTIFCKTFDNEVNDNNDVYNKPHYGNKNDDDFFKLL